MRGDDSAYKQQEEEKQLSHLLAVIRYPADFTAAARAQYEQSYKDTVIQFTDRNDDEAAYATGESYYAGEALSKTVYYALELYAALAEKMPEHSVVLQPLEVDYQSGKYIFKTKSDYPPTVLTVDLFAYRFPTNDLIKDSPMTFGDLAAPLVTVRTSFQGSPTTLGAISMVDSLSLNVNKTIHFDPRSGSSGGAGHSLLEFLAAPSSDEHFPALLSHSQPRPANTMLSYPLENITLDSNLIEIGSSRNSEGGSPVGQILEPYVNTVVDALNDIDPYLATREARRNYFANFDKTLAQNYPNIAVSKPDKTRALILNKLIQIDMKFLSKRSRKMYEGLYSGKFGESMRQLIADELAHIEEVRDQLSERSFNTFNTWLGTATSLLATFAESQGAQPVAGVPNLGEVFAKDMAFTEKNRAEQESLHSSFTTHMASFYSAQTEMVLENGKRVPVQQLNELRKISQKFYVNKTRRLPPSPTQQPGPALQGLNNEDPRWMQDPRLGCWVWMPEGGSSVQARWSGTCPNGKASGYGLLSLQEGNKYICEYEGKLSGGKPHGFGTYIMRDMANPELFSMLEGFFKEGQPDGVLLVNQPGEEPDYYTAEKWLVKRSEATSGGGNVTKTFKGFFSGFGSASEEEVAFEEKRSSYHALRISPVVVKVKHALPPPKEIVKVKSATLNVRGGPGAKFNIVSSAKQGELLMILERKAKWLHVRTTSGEDGWVAEWLTDKRK